MKITSLINIPQMLEKEGHVELATAVRKFLDKHCIITWSREDISDVAHTLRVELSDEECVEVLKDIESGHDCEYGITWETLRCYVQDFVDEREAYEQTREGRR